MSAAEMVFGRGDVGIGVETSGCDGALSGGVSDGMPPATAKSSSRS